MEIAASNGRSPGDRWAPGAEALRGIIAIGFPNLFMHYRPNTNLGSNSIIYMAECQITHILDFVHKLSRPYVESLSAKPAVIRKYDEALQKELSRIVWSWGCSSWYHTEGGRITNNWPGTNIRYKTRHGPGRSEGLPP